MLAIYKRELKAFMDTMTGWIFVAAVMFITGLYFIAINLMGGYSDVSITVSNSLFTYIIAIPMLTMRVLTEERRQKIDQLILTSPVGLSKVVLGKYLAMCTILLIPILVVCVYPLILSMYGTVEFAKAYVAILGFLLYGMAAIALGLFISSLTESIVIAAILSFAAMFVTYIMNGIISIVTNTKNGLTDILEKILGLFAFDSHVTDMFNGLLNLRSVIYFVVVTILLIFLTTQVIQKRRFTVSKSTLSVSAYSVGTIVASIAAAVLINFIVEAIPDKYMSFDVTSQKLYSITDTSRKLLDGLDKDVEIYIIQDENSKDDTIDKTVKQYADASDHVTYQYKDPVTNPTFYKQYNDGQMSINSLIVVCGDKYKVIDASNMYASELDYSTYSYKTTGYDGEGQLTSAINYVTTDNMPKGYYTTGHGESQLGGNFSDAIQKMNVELSELNLLTVDAVPDDADFVMILGPQSDFSADDAKKIIDYAKAGGKIYVCTFAMEDSQEVLPNFCSILREFGVSTVPGILVEQDRNYFYQSPYYLLPNVQYSDLTSDFYDQKYIFAPYAQAITVEEADDTEVDYILKSSDSSMSYTEGADEKELEQKSYALAASITKTFDGQKGRMIIFSSINMLSDDADNMVSNTNSKLFGNCIASFVPDDIGNVSIPVKSYSNDSLIIDNGMGIMYGVICAIVIPVVLLIAGFVIWFRRRKR